MMHIRDFLHLVVVVILYDAKRIDPEISDADTVCDGHCIPDGLSKRVQCYLTFVAWKSLFGCLEMLITAPAVAQRGVGTRVWILHKTDM